MRTLCVLAVALLACEHTSRQFPDARPLEAPPITARTPSPASPVPPPPTADATTRFLRGLADAYDFETALPGLVSGDTPQCLAAVAHEPPSDALHVLRGLCMMRSDCAQGTNYIYAQVGAVAAEHIEAQQQDYCAPWQGTPAERAGRLCAQVGGFMRNRWPQFRDELLAQAQAPEILALPEVSPGSRRDCGNGKTHLRNAFKTVFRQSRPIAPISLC